MLRRLGRVLLEDVALQISGRQFGDAAVRPGQAREGSQTQAVVFRRTGVPSTLLALLPQLPFVRAVLLDGLGERHRAGTGLAGQDAAPRIPTLVPGRIETVALLDDCTATEERLAKRKGILLRLPATHHRLIADVAPDGF